MRRKLEIMFLIVLLGGLVFVSHTAGDYLIERTGTNDGVETTAKPEKTLVILDSGHGGSDPGKIGINGALEKEINLKIAEEVKKYLKKYKIEVIMTRTDDGGLGNSKTEDLKTRVTMINEKKPVLAVSIHQNSYHQESIHGAQVFYFTHSKEGKEAAALMQESLLAVDSDNTRQAKANDTYYLLKKTEVPVIIVECGFLSNQKEADRLVTGEYQKQLAEAIGEGIVAFVSK